MLDAQATRLREARSRRYESGSDAARAHGWKVSTYLAHENGQNALRLDAAKKYARAFRVPWLWLFSGEGSSEPDGEPAKVPLVGYVGAGAEAHFYAGADNPDELVDAPDNATESTVAVEVHGESLGALFDRWLVFYDDIKTPVTTDLIGRLCVVGLPDDRVLVKMIKRSRSDGLYHLLSNTEGPILDVEILWAAKVKTMMPR